MKNIIGNFCSFVLLAFIFSGLTACNQTASSSNNAANEKASAPPSAETVSGGNVSNTEKAAKRSSDFPPVAAAIMQAEIKKLDGSTLKVEDFKGKVVLLNLWATWCGPCRAEMPELVALEEKFKDKGYKTIGLNVDNEPLDEVKSFTEQMKLNYEIAWADETLTKELFKTSKSGGIPQSFIIDRDGNLRGVITGGGPRAVAAVKETVEKVVNE